MFGFGKSRRLVNLTREAVMEAKSRTRKMVETVDEANSLVKTGVEQVCKMEDAKLFRKRK